MKRTKIIKLYEDPAQFADQEITVMGWARNIRDQKSFGFIELNDGSAFKPVQVVFERETLENYDEIARQNVGAALIVTGILVLTPGAKQPFELKAKKIEVEG
ncbi:MAG: asparagine--tRNA ligase, partial [Oscillospiraceae bacterium]|nr:asparagine--tRNA ligase [Oscillospiraceae bacterium]